MKMWVSVETPYVAGRSVLLEPGGRYQVKKNSRWKRFTLEDHVEKLEFPGKDGLTIRIDKLQPGNMFSISEHRDQLGETESFKYERGVWRKTKEKVEIFFYPQVCWEEAPLGRQKSGLVKLGEGGSFIIGGVRGTFNNFSLKNVAFDSPLGPINVTTSAGEVCHLFITLLNPTPEALSQTGGFETEIYHYLDDRWCVRVD